MGPAQEPEPAQQQLEQLLALRERLTRDAKGSRGPARPANLDSDPQPQQQHQCVDQSRQGVLHSCLELTRPLPRLAGL